MRSLIVVCFFFCQVAYAQATAAYQTRSLDYKKEQRLIVSTFFACKEIDLAELMYYLLFFEKDVDLFVTLVHAYLDARICEAVYMDIEPDRAARCLRSPELKPCATWELNTGKNSFFYGFIMPNELVEQIREARR